jgi:sulfatase modifying factor 1
MAIMTVTQPRYATERVVASLICALLLLHSEAETSASDKPTVAKATSDAIHVPSGVVKLDGKRIEVTGFTVDRTEVTVRSYAQCVDAGRCKAPAREAGCNSLHARAQQMHPVNCVTAEHARAFCNWRGARLPSVAEWTLAAGGPEGRTYPWGNLSPSLVSFDEMPVHGSFPPGPARHYLCWMGDGTTTETYPHATCPVGSYPKGDTPSGIADMAGNVWEWTSDVVTLPQGGKNYVMKGGGFRHDPTGLIEVHVVDEQKHARDHFDVDIGFRCLAPDAP